MKLLLSLLLASLFLSQTAYTRMVHGGTEVGNGGDHLPPYHQSAWFLGSDRSIRVCLKVGESFPLTADEAEVSVRNAFERWIEYIRAKGVYEAGFLFESEEGDPEEATLRFAEKLLIAHRCRGSEDLTIYLGQQNRSVDKIRSQFSDPLSFAYREKFDPEAGWSKGFLWVRSESFKEAGWEKPYVLDTVLLHEFGHIFGLGHVPHTIMAEKFVEQTARQLEYLASERKLDDREKMNSIFLVDTFRELYACLNCDNTFRAPTSKESLGLLSKVAGRQVMGSSISCRIQFPSRHANLYLLTCVDSQGKELWTIEPAADRVPVFSGFEAFKRMKMKEGFLKSESVEALNGEFGYGKLVNEAGKAFTVVLERSVNANSPTLTIKLMIDGRVEYFFTSNDVMKRLNGL